MTTPLSRIREFRRARLFGALAEEPPRYTNIGNYFALWEILSHLLWFGKDFSLQQEPFMEKTQHTEQYQKLVRELKVARVRAGLKQQEVATKLGVYNSYVSKCESGERKIDVVELAQFCHLYGITLSQFLKQIELD